MADAPQELSRNSLEVLITRALELDAVHSDRISLAKAREIAQDLGITASAWNAAVAERVQAAAAIEHPPRQAWPGLQTVLTGAAGVGAGFIGGMLNRTLNGDADVVYGALLVTVGMILSTRRRDESAEAALTRLDAWWVAVPAGMLLAFGGLRTDPLFFAALARWGTSTVTSLIPRIRRRLHASRSMA